MNKIFFFTFWLFFIFLIAQEQEFQTTEGFRLKLPEDWIEIPKEVLDDYSKMVQEMNPQTEKQVYQCGYQLKENEEWLTHPYILIQVKKSGRIPESYLKNLKTIQAGMEEGLNQAESNFKELVTRTSMEQPVYDKINHILFATLTANVSGVGIVNGLIAVKLTEKGTINIYGYALKEDFAEYLELYKKIALQIKIEDPSLIYKPRVTDMLPSFLVNMNWTRVILGALIGGLIGMFVSLKNKKNIELAKPQSEEFSQ